MGQAPIRVIYVMGCGRSGSTVLDSVLAHHPDVVGVGELNQFDQAPQANAYCACQHQIRRCPFWVQVVRRWQRDSSVEYGQYVSLRATFERARALGGTSWLRLIGHRQWRDSRRLHSYLDQTRRLYEAIARTSGRRTIVESSKAPLRAALLRQMPGIELRLIHLVRDVRGVAWSRKKALSAAPRAGVACPQPGRSVWYSTLYWLLSNALAAQVRRSHAPHSMLLRYEDFVTHTRQALAEISALADVDFSQIHDVRAGQVPLGHVFAGNRLRMTPGRKLALDLEWQNRLTALEQRLAWFATRRMLRQYGYRWGHHPA